MKKLQKTLVLGHSHGMAIKNAANFDENAFDYYGLPDTTEQVKDYIRGIPVDCYDRVIMLIKGNHHTIFGMVNHPRPYDFYFKDTEFEAGAEYISYSLMYDVLYDFMLQHNMLTMYDVLAEAYKSCSLYQVESPPPLPRSHIERNPGPFSESISLHGIAGDMFRYKLWRLHSRIVSDYCAKLGIGFINVPMGAMTGNGTLIDNYCAEDATHANSNYGALVIDEINRMK